MARKTSIEERKKDIIFSSACIIPTRKYQEQGKCSIKHT
jgi:hypothetical protein